MEEIISAIDSLHLPVEALHTFNQEYREVFKFDGEHKIAQAEVEKVVPKLVASLLARADGEWSEADISAASEEMSAIKILTRTRTGLDALFSKEFIKALLTIGARFKGSELKDNSDSADADAEVPDSNTKKLFESSLAIVCNCCILQHDKVLEIVDELKPYDQLSDMLENGTGFRALYLLCRVLFYMTVRPNFAKQFLDDTKVFELLIQAALKTAKVDKFWLDPPQCQYFCEVFKVIFNFAMHTDTQQDTPSKNLFQRRLTEAQFDELAKSVVHILGLPLSECDPDFDTKNRSKPPKPNLLLCKLQIINCLLNVQNNLADLFNDQKTLVGLGVLLEYQVRDPGNAEANLAPILGVLNGLCRADATILNFFRHMIWGPDCDKPRPARDPDKSMDPEPDANANEGVMSVRMILLKHMTTFHMTLKSQVQEFLYTLCHRESQEFIDRTGFGNAVGLLQQLGMPGLQNLTSRAVDLDQLAKERAAEKAAEAAAAAKEDEKDGSSAPPKPKDDDNSGGDAGAAASST